MRESVDLAILLHGYTYLIDERADGQIEVHKTLANPDAFLGFKAIPFS